MPVKIITKKDEAPEDADLLELKDGTFAFVEEDADARATIAKIRAERKDAEKRAKDAEARIVELQRDLDVAKASGGDVDKRIADLSAKWQKEREDAIAAKDKEHESTKAELRQIKLYDKAREAFVKAGGRPEKADAALKLKGDRLDLVDGRTVVLDDDGEVSTLSVDDLWGKQFRKEMPEFFAGSKGEGSGAGGEMRPGRTDGGKPTNEDVVKNPSIGFQHAFSGGKAA
jgi:hypothetical protein